MGHPLFWLEPRDTIPSHGVSMPTGEVIFRMPFLDPGAGTLHWHHNTTDGIQSADDTEKSPQTGKAGVEKQPLLPLVANKKGPLAFKFERSEFRLSGARAAMIAAPDTMRGEEPRATFIRPKADNTTA